MLSSGIDTKSLTWETLSKPSIESFSSGNDNLKIDVRRETKEYATQLIDVHYLANKSSETNVNVFEKYPILFTPVKGMSQKASIDVEAIKLSVEFSNKLMEQTEKKMNRVLN